MPHDRKGTLLQEGDQVLVPCVVKSVMANEDFCNVQLETVELMYPGENKSIVTLNAKQVEKV